MYSGLLATAIVPSNDPRHIESGRCKIDLATGCNWYDTKITEVISCGPLPLSCFSQVDALSAGSQKRFRVCLTAL